jgi:hypothetical protein
LTFCAISDKTGYIPKVLQGGRKVVDVILVGNHENSGVIGIKRGADRGSPPPQLMEMPLFGGLPENVMKWINGQHKEERRQRVPLSEPPSMLDGVSGDAIEKHS